ncbi:MAG: histidine--tRNA ligase [Bacilli bacterium]
MKLMNVKGTSDSLPKEELIKRRVINTLTSTFDNFGYMPLDTTILCYYDLLASKYAGGSEILKEVYTLNDQANRQLGLRYDLTVPFSKVISMNINKNITLPFKRYEVGKVFRDGPVKTGRAREFYQCDVDVCGIEGTYIEAEMLSMTSICYKKLGIEVYIEVNNRKLLEGFIIASGINEDIKNKVILSVDKLAKIGEQGVKEELSSYNIEEEKLNKLFNYFKCTIDELDDLNITNDSFIKGKEEIKELFNYLTNLGITECKFTPYLARGLEIYTGTVFEVFDKKQRITSAIGGGGRYDKIITNFINDGNIYPAVGISFGIVPICEILKEETEEALYDILIVPMNTNLETLKLANKLREENIKVLIEMNNRKLKKVLESADKNNIPYVIVVGENEVNNEYIEIKDMKNKTTNRFNINDIKEMIKFIRG